MFLTAAATASFPHRYSQDEICTWVEKRTSDARSEEWIRNLFRNTGVEYRAFALPLEEIAKPREFGERNALFTEHAPHLLQPAIAKALQQANLKPTDVDAVVTVTSSGFMTPSLDAHLINICGFPPETLRLPIVGLGCAAGISGLSHAIAWANGRQQHNVVFAAIELNSLTYRPGDAAKVNSIGAALFGDGAAVVVCRGDVHGGWKYAASASYTLPQSTDLMGWDMAADGYGLILSEDVPDAVAEMAPKPLRRFLEENALTQSDLKKWVIHPGGPKILSRLSEATGLTGEPIDRSRRGLAAHGNQSSCSALYSLADLLTEPAHVGDTCCCLAFGPGFSMEMLLLKYQS